MSKGPLFSHAKHILQKAKEAGRESDNYVEAYNKYIEMALVEFDEILRIADLLHKRFEKQKGEDQSGYFITIRPDDAKTTFIAFKEKVESFVKRKCFKKVTYSFEQKGTSTEDIGRGYHVHIVTSTSLSSKKECLRATLSSWNEWIEKDWLASNCIEVVHTKNMESLIKGYLINYESADDHKAATRVFDEEWRRQLNLLPIYKIECDQGE